MTNSEQKLQSKQAEVTTGSLVGSLLSDRYAIDSVIGMGGMGTVYRGEQILLHRPVAIKVCNLAENHETASQRFLREARAASTLSHPNVVAVHDCGLDSGGRPFLVMEFIDGDGLDTILKREGTLAPERFLRIFRQVAAGLSEAHNKGLVHRDIKPSNIMIERRQEAEVAKIADFGLAKWNSSEDEQSLTKTGDVYGTPLYMSPEQGLGNRVDGRADIYSLGCVMFHCMTGKPPYVGATPIETACQHINSEIPSILESVPGTAQNSNIDAVIRRCMQKKAEDRYQNVQELAGDLELCLSDGQVTQPARKQPFLRNAALLVLVPIIFGLAAFFIMTKHQPHDSPISHPGATNGAQHSNQFDDLYDAAQSEFASKHWRKASDGFQKAFEYSKTNQVDPRKVVAVLRKWGFSEGCMHEHDKEETLYGIWESIAKKQFGKNDRERIWALRRLAHAAVLNRHTDKAAQDAEEAISLTEKFEGKDIAELGDSYWDYSTVQLTRGNYPLAIEYGIKAHQDKFKDKWGYYFGAENVADAYKQMKKPDQALHWYQEAAQSWISYGDEKAAARCLGSALAILMEEHRTKEAERVARQIQQLRRLRS